MLDEVEAEEPVVRPRRRRILKIVLIAAGALLVTMIGLFALVWAMTPIPDSTQAAATAQGSVIFYRDGKTVLAKPGVNRVSVPLTRVPKLVRDAVIAAENRTFYQDQGVSLTGTVRAMWSTVTGQQLQGGSTITQQMVRNYYSGLSQERSATRKLKEIMIALKVDRSQSKDWVLEQYLNTIYFGRGAYGIQAAAQAYFNTDVTKLTPAQGAYLAAVIQQPTRFANPTGADLVAVRARWQSVISGMTQIKALTPAEATQLTFPKLAEQKDPLPLDGQNGYMLAQVTAELHRLGYTDEDIKQGGLKVTTTFDKKLMALAEESVNAILPPSTPKKVRTGLAAIDPATGEVVAFYGGRFERNQYDNAFSAKVQAGSTFKPYTLAAALENGFDLGTRVNGNSPLRIASVKKPIPNAGGASYGSAINLVQATRHSVNTAFVDLGQKVGLDKVAAIAQAVGIPRDQIAAQEAYPTFPLGTSSVSAVQQASGFATFAANGVHREAHVIRSVTDAQGNVKAHTVEGVRAFSKQTAADATYAMEQVVTGGTGTAARLYDRPVAGKTGTTDEGAALWFDGFTPQLTVAVNMFRDDNKAVRIPGYGDLYGGTFPAQIWKYFMTKAMEGKPVKDFPEPSSAWRYGYYDRYGQDNGNGGDNQNITPTPEVSPSLVPTTDPSTEPTEAPTDEPTEQPTDQPTEQPTEQPTAIPTLTAG